MLCKYGCGKVGIFTLKDGSVSCGKTAMYCPIINQKAGKNSGITRRKNPIKFTEERINDISTRVKKEWEDGIRKPHSPEKQAEFSRLGVDAKRINGVIIPWNKALKDVQIPWNKGLKKIEPMKILDRTDPIYQNFKKYRNRIAVRTKKL